MAPGIESAADDVDQRSDVLRHVEEYSNNPSSFLALNEGTSFYSDDEIDGSVCHRVRRKFWIQFGGPLAATDNRARLQSSFIHAANNHGCRVIALQLQSHDAALFNGLDIPVDQMGASYAVDLHEHSLRGKRFVRLRNKISRAHRAGLQVSEVDYSGVRGAIDDINSHWLRGKGRLAKELEFLIGQLGGPYQKMRRLYVGCIEGEVVGYISYAPAYGTRSGWLHDLSRRHPSCPPGVMEAINAHAIAAFQKEGVDWLHFGFTPFTGLSESHELQLHRPAVQRVFGLLASHGEAVYPAQSQLDYKMKWAPSDITPEYMAFTGRLTPAVVWNLLRVLNIV